MRGRRLRVVVVEGDGPARVRMVRLLEAAGCSVLNTFAEDLAALAWLRAHGEVDTVFLGADLPGLEGLAVLRALGAQLPMVVATSEPEQALAAFDAEAVDCLLKPFSALRLERALKRVEQRLEPLPEPRPVQSSPQRYPVQAGEGVVLVDLQRTSYFEVERGVVWAHAGGRWRTRWKALAEVAEAFPVAGLLRIHRHLLVRPEAVLGFRPAEGGRMLVRLSGGEEIEASKGGSPRLREYFRTGGSAAGRCQAGQK